MDENVTQDVSQSGQGNVSADNGAQSPSQSAGFTQDDVNRIVGSVRAEERKKWEQQQAQSKQDKQWQEPAKPQSNNAQWQQHNQQPQQASKPLDVESLKREILQEYSAEQQQKEAEAFINQAAQNFHTQMQSGKELYENWDEKTKHFRPADFPELSLFVQETGKTAEVMNELLDHPSKLATLDSFAKTSPTLVRAELQKLVASLNQNEATRKNADSNRVNEPLDHIKPSRVSGSDGRPSVSQLKKMSRYKV